MEEELKQLQTKVNSLITSNNHYRELFELNKIQQKITNNQIKHLQDKCDKLSQAMLVLNFK